MQSRGTELRGASPGSPEGETAGAAPLGSRLLLHSGGSFVEQEDVFLVPGPPLVQRGCQGTLLFSQAGKDTHRKAEGAKGKRLGVGMGWGWGVGAVNVSSPSYGVLVENSGSGVKE